MRHSSAGSGSPLITRAGFELSVQNSQRLLIFPHLLLLQLREECRLTWFEGKAGNTYGQWDMVGYFCWWKHLEQGQFNFHDASFSPGTRCCWSLKKIRWRHNYRNRSWTRLLLPTQYLFYRWFICLFKKSLLLLRHEAHQRVMSNAPSFYRAIFPTWTDVRHKIHPCLNIAWRYELLAPILQWFPALNLLQQPIRCRLEGLFGKDMGWPLYARHLISSALHPWSHTHVCKLGSNEATLPAEKGLVQKRQNMHGCETSKNSRANQIY